MKIKLKRKIARRPHRLRGVSTRRPFDELPMETRVKIADKIKKVTRQLDPDYEEAAHVD